MVPHPGAGDDAGVAELHRGAHPARPPGGQGVHGNDAGGLYLRRQAPHRLGGLHAGGAQHPRPQHAHGTKAGKLPGHGGNEVPGHQHVVRRQGAHGVGCHGPVPKAHHQHRPLGWYQLLQRGAHRPHRPLKKVLPPLPEGGQVHGEIGAPGLAQGLLPPLVQDVHPGHRIALLLSLRGLHARQTGGFSGGFLPELPGLQGQVCSFCKQKRRLQTQNLVVLALGFADETTIYEKSQKLQKNTCFLGGSLLKYHSARWKFVSPGEFA